jgi:hypothetical protein
MELKEGEILRALIYLLKKEGAQDALYFYGQDINNLFAGFNGNIQGFVDRLCEGQFNNVKTIYVNVETYEQELRKRPVLDFIKSLMPSYNGQQVSLIQKEQSGNHMVLPELKQSNSTPNAKPNANAPRSNANANANATGGKGKKRASSTKSPKIHTGPNGGKYYIKSGKKVYVK